MAESNPLRGFPRLRRAATSFPGNLHLVLVLRPTGLFSSTPSPSSSTDLGFRFSQDDFLLKMPVVMLRSVGDLLRYIDENHLTTDFTAKVEYCQSDWIVLRTAIETFAVTVKEIAQLLQGFGSELSETELPDEANAIEFLLHSHTHRYRQMKDDIRSVTKEGRLLLSNLETVKASKRDVEEERDIKSDMDTVQRLLAQLRDMEEAFDGFFEKHHLKMHQYLQLLHYEMSFQQMEEALERISDQETDIASVGTTVVQTEQLLMDLEMLDTCAQEEMGHAQVLILHGHQLAANHHYALALIVQRCNELRHHCDIITTAVRTKRASLTRARDLLLRLEGALRWCDDGAYVLASQMVDKFQTREGAQEALQYLSSHQERAPSALKNSQDILSLEFEAILTPQLQSQISMVTEKLNAVQSMIRNREQCLRKLADVQVRPIQLVAPRPEPEQRCKSPLFSPKHGVDFNVLNSKFSFDLLPGKRAARRNNSQRKIEVMHDFQGNRSCVYGSAPETDSEAEDNPEQLTRHIMKELIATERIYVDELLSVLLGYRAEMEDPSMSNLLPPALRSQKDVLFGNMPEIYQLHSRIFLQDLQGCLETPERVGTCFLQRKEKFQVYERYCQNKPCSELLWRQCSDSPFFKECQKKLDHKLGLDSYLLKPVQRLTKYQLLLKELLKHCREERHRCELQQALDSMLELLKSVNDSMHQIAITGYQGDLSQLGRVVMQGGFSVWISHKRAAVRMKELARFKPMQRHLFLYDFALLFCKRRDEDTHERTPFYSFKSCLKMSAVGITENVKGDVKKFEIWYSGREVVYIVQAPTLEVKVAWLTEIRKILTNQRKMCQDETPSLQLSDNTLSDSASEMCVSWGGASVGGCSACLPFPHSSSVTSYSHRLRGEESIYTSPTHTEPVVHSPRRTWPVPAHSVAICEGLEDWGVATDLSNLSDSDEEDQPAPLVAGRYRVMVESSMASTDDIIFNCGDVIQLLHEEMSGMWMVRNVSRGEEGRVLPEDLNRILGETC
ncbi:proto-oncogene DBL isoform X1 [Anarrhichthys ocellatus]|uniref:proto-oncogene DBL isoform X1 n=1 Tax=Anarrhichthys ocellatus TaxID=433405 RepID=UPI0012EE0AF9|nr:proto-oncogene DBL-like isoform X1 [Anarrhichthys ocellatus]XP_031713059.1 proto-oncogene DBL-like isoform X1 [Anarrhichthys ocellatus]XP_031713060.1 proto-oncogene DBL-like isoform X1 [Anarrhichthys ocellatus]XP_031713061.1 proto-oncogene DBL-like isoform X1 [Anarrhichthys ocellatus]